MLVNRVSHLDLTWRQEMEELSNRPSPSLELTLDDLGLRRSIEQMTFLEMKRKLTLHCANLVYRSFMWSLPPVRAVNCLYPAGQKKNVVSKPEI